MGAGPVAVDANLRGGSIEDRGLLGAGVGVELSDPPVQDPGKLNTEHEEERTDDPPSAPEPAAHDPEHEEEFPDAPPAAAPPFAFAPSR